MEQFQPLQLRIRSSAKGNYKIEAVTILNDLISEILQKEDIQIEQFKSEYKSAVTIKKGFPPKPMDLT